MAYLINLASTKTLTTTEEIDMLRQQFHGINTNREVRPMGAHFDCESTVAKGTMYDLYITYFLGLLIPNSDFLHPVLF